MQHPIGVSLSLTLIWAIPKGWDKYLYGNYQARWVVSQVHNPFSMWPDLPRTGLTMAATEERGDGAGDAMQRWGRRHVAGRWWHVMVAEHGGGAGGVTRWWGRRRVVGWCWRAVSVTPI
jgi:hypothetical protein